MDVVYKRKHKKAHPMRVQFRKWNKFIHVYSKLGIDLLKLDMKILKANCQIAYYTIGDLNERLINAHDKKWDDIEAKVDAHVHSARIYLSREKTSWQKYFRSLRDGLD